MVVHGDDDPIPTESARTVAALLGAPFHLLPACGHVPQVEAVELAGLRIEGSLAAGVPLDPPSPADAHRQDQGIRGYLFCILNMGLEISMSAVALLHAVGMLYRTAILRTALTSTS